MRVHIIGPNLRDQSKGDFHVHAEGCADVNRSPEYQAPDYKSDREHPVEVASIQQIVEFTYADQIGEGSMTWQDGVSDFHLFPCCLDQLPSVTPPEQAKSQPILVIGNPIDGLRFYGPFTDDESAMTYAEDERLSEWWLTTIENVK